MKLDPTSQYTKTNKHTSKWIKDIYVRPQTVKHLEENKGVN